MIKLKRDFRILLWQMFSQCCEGGVKILTPSSGVCGGWSAEKGIVDLKEALSYGVAFYLSEAENCFPAQLKFPPNFRGNN